MKTWPLWIATALVVATQIGCTVVIASELRGIGAELVAIAESAEALEARFAGNASWEGFRRQDAAEKDFLNGPGFTLKDGKEVSVR